MRTLTERWRRHPESGQRLGPFQLVELIGQGDRSWVWAANRATDAAPEVAIKRLRAGSNDAAHAGFLREMAWQAQLRHPAIPQLLACGVDRYGWPWFALERIYGEPLDVRARRQPANLGQRLQWLQQACVAVGFLHQQGLAHADLKPAHLLVNAQNRVILLDFGAVRVSGGTCALSDPSPFAPNYAAPEQWRGAGSTAASDVYALGVLLHELLTGQRPFVARGAGLPRAALAAEFVPPSAGLQLPEPWAPALASLLRACLDPDPARRPADAILLAEALQSGLDQTRLEPSA